MLSGFSGSTGKEDAFWVHNISGFGLNVAKDNFS
jgi:hypothetical protein